MNESQVPLLFEPRGPWLVGRIQLDAVDDPRCIDEFERLFAQAVAEHPDVKHVAIDFSRVSFVVTRVLSVLLTMQKQQSQRGGRVVLCGVDPQVARHLRLTRLDRVFDIYPGVDALPQV